MVNILNHTSYVRMLAIAYRLRTSESMSSHSIKWRKEQPLIFNNTSCVRMLTKHVTYSLSTSEWVHIAASGEKSNHCFLITSFCVRMLVKLTRWAQVNAQVNSHSSKWWKEQSFIVTYTPCVSQILCQNVNQIWK